MCFIELFLMANFLLSRDTFIFVVIILGVISGNVQRLFLAVYAGVAPVSAWRSLIQCWREITLELDTRKTHVLTPVLSFPLGAIL